MLGRSKNKITSVNSVTAFEVLGIFRNNILSWNDQSLTTVFAQRITQNTRVECNKCDKTTK